MPDLTHHEAEFSDTPACPACGAHMVTLIDDADRQWLGCPDCTLDLPGHIRALIFGGR